MPCFPCCSSNSTRVHPIQVLPCEAEECRTVNAEHRQEEEGQDDPPAQATPAFSTLQEKLFEEILKSNTNIKASVENDDATGTTEQQQTEDETASVVADETKTKGRAAADETKAKGRSLTQRVLGPLKRNQQLEAVVSTELISYLDDTGKSTATQSAGASKPRSMLRGLLPISRRSDGTADSAEGGCLNRIRIPPIFRGKSATGNTESDTKEDHCHGTPPPGIYNEEEVKLMEQIQQEHGSGTAA